MSSERELCCSVSFVAGAEAEMDHPEQSNICTFFFLVSFPECISSATGPLCHTRSLPSHWKEKKRKKKDPNSTGSVSKKVGLVF